MTTQQIEELDREHRAITRELDQFIANAESRRRPVTKAITAPPETQALPLHRRLGRFRQNWQRLDPAERFEEAEAILKASFEANRAGQLPAPHLREIEMELRPILQQRPQLVAKAIRVDDQNMFRGTMSFNEWGCRRMLAVNGLHPATWGF